MSSSTSEKPNLNDLLEPYKFQTDVRVRFPETDAMGVVFHGEFFTYMEVGRTDYLTNLGLTRSRKPIADFDNLVVSCGCDYFAPARNHDQLLVHVRTAEVGQSSFKFEFVFEHKKDSILIAHGYSTHVAIDTSTNESVRVPEDFRETICSFEENL